MKVLGIDPSLTAFGWALHDSSATGVMRRVDSGHVKTLTTTVPVARYMHLRSVVDSLLIAHNPDMIGMESPAFDAGPFQTIHFSIMMFVMESIFKMRKDLVLFDPSTLKSLVRGTSKTPKTVIAKQDVQKFVSLDTMDPNIIDNNEADAYAIAYFAGRFRRTLEGSLDPKELSDQEMHTFISKTKTVKTLKGKKEVKTGHVFRENTRYFSFSKIPQGDVTLPNKSEINPALMSFLVGSETE